VMCRTNMAQLERTSIQWLEETYKTEKGEVGESLL